MKTFSKTLSIAALTVLISLLSASLNAQVVVTIHQPPPGQLNVEDLWSIDLTNNTQETFTIYLRGTATEERDGLIFEGSSSTFSLPPGFRRVSLRDMTIDVEYSKKKYEDIVLRTGSVSEGNYTVCIYVINADNGEELGRDCIQQQVAHPSPPQLISPMDGATVEDEFPVFTWMPPMPLPQELSYDLRIVEILTGQSPVYAMQSNPPWFEEKEIRSTSFRYPVGARAFEQGKTYCWQVTPWMGDWEIGSSEIWSFKAGPQPPGEAVTLELIFPRDVEEIDSPTPRFEWTLIDLPEVSCSLTIWQLPEGLAERVMEGYTLTEEDLADIEPYFVKEEIEEIFFVYTDTTDYPLVPEFSYCWQVKVWMDEREIGMSEISTFSLKTAEMEEIILDHFIPDTLFSGTESKSTLIGNGFIHGMKFEVPYGGIDVIDAQFQDSKHYQIHFNITSNVAPGHYMFMVKSVPGRPNPPPIALNVTRDDCREILKKYNALRAINDTKAKDCRKLEAKVKALRDQKRDAEAERDRRQQQLKDADKNLKDAKKALNRAKQELNDLINRAIHSDEISTTPKQGLDNWIGLYDGEVRIYFSGSDTSIDILLWFLREYRDQWTKSRDKCRKTADELAKWEKVKNKTKKALQEAEEELKKATGELKAAEKALKDCKNKLKELDKKKKELWKKYKHCLDRLEAQRKCEENIDNSTATCEEADSTIANAEKEINRINEEFEGLKDPCKEAKELLEEAKKLLEEAKQEAKEAQSKNDEAKRAYKNGDLDTANRLADEAERLAASAKTKADEAKTKASEAKVEIDECKSAEEARRASAQTEREEMTWLLENIRELGLIRSDRFWQTPGLWDWLPELLQAPVGYAAEDLAHIPIPTDAIKALGGIYNIVAALLDPCTQAGMRKSVERLEKKINSRTGYKYTLNEALDKTNEMCNLLRKLRSLAHEANRRK